MKNSFDNSLIIKKSPKSQKSDLNKTTPAFVLDNFNLLEQNSIRANSTTILIKKNKSKVTFFCKKR